MLSISLINNRFYGIEVCMNGEGICIMNRVYIRYLLTKHIKEDIFYSPQHSLEVYTKVGLLITLIMLRIEVKIC